LRAKRSPPPAAASAQKAQDDEKKEGADCGCDDGSGDPRPKADTQLRQEPTANKGADDANADIPDETETKTPDDEARKPPSHQTDHEYDEKTFA
jgi:hypothetical protein